MKLFTCPHCGQRLYFENSLCLNCNTPVAYHPHRGEFVVAGAAGAPICTNAGECDCNWVAEENLNLCLACSLNHTIPDLSVEGNRLRWTKLEMAKKRTVYTLLALHLPVAPKASPEEEVGIAFDFLGDPIGPGPGGERILTGHDNGLITLNVAEADSPEREAMRVAMGERYRTLLGHFRHELGHYYWDRLIRDNPEQLAAFRDIFGDEQVDYAQSLQNHYSNGAPTGWANEHISAYAASHPWEDWAECWAHYLHIVDTLEMAEAFKVPLERLDVPTPPDPNATEFQGVLSRWITLSEVVNSINRCMGLGDLYPFVISQPVAKKLTFIDGLLKQTSGVAAQHVEHSAA
ncbi:MAG TPA: putative zinc-binding metallopeptidase [Tianweitania sediminis]|nr:putative zinc-binding metallopeptidase [Tianweitania sediminis]